MSRKSRARSVFKAIIYSIIGIIAVPFLFGLVNFIRNQDKFYNQSGKEDDRYRELFTEEALADFSFRRSYVKEGKAPITVYKYLNGKFDILVGALDYVELDSSVVIIYPRTVPFYFYSLNVNSFQIGGLDLSVTVDPDYPIDNSKVYLSLSGESLVKTKLSDSKIHYRIFLKDLKILYDLHGDPIWTYTGGMTDRLLGGKFCEIALIRNGQNVCIVFLAPSTTNDNNSNRQRLIDILK